MKDHLMMFKMIYLIVILFLKLYFFFDDRLENLEPAFQMGWFTFWIHPNYKVGNQYDYITMSFSTIKDCLTYLETKY